MPLESVATAGALSARGRRTEVFRRPDCGGASGARKGGQRWSAVAGYSAIPSHDAIAHAVYRSVEGIAHDGDGRGGVNALFQFRYRIALSLLVVCGLAGAGIYRLHVRRAARPSDLVGYLPAANASVIYIDVDALRRSGFLGMLAGSKTAEEPDYQQFVQATKFDYAHDLDAVAAALKDGRIYFALRGRFHWNNLWTMAARDRRILSQRFWRDAGKPAESGRISFAIR